MGLIAMRHFVVAREVALGTVQRWVCADDRSLKPFVSGCSNTWVPNL